MVRTALQGSNGKIQSLHIQTSTGNTFQIQRAVTLIDESHRAHDGITVAKNTIPQQYRQIQLRDPVLYLTVLLILRKGGGQPIQRGLTVQDAVAFIIQLAGIMPIHITHTKGVVTVVSSTKGRVLKSGCCVKGNLFPLQMAQITFGFISAK